MHSHSGETDSTSTIEQDDILTALRHDNRSKYSSNTAENILFMNFYSRESTGPNCDKSSGPRLKNGKDDGRRQPSSPESNKRVKAFKPTGVVLEEPMRRVTKPRKEYMTKRKREIAALLAKQNAQCLLSNMMTIPTQDFQFDYQQESSPYLSSQDIRVNTSSSIEPTISTESNELGYNSEIVNDLYSFQNISFNSNVPSCKSCHPPIITPVLLTCGDGTKTTESNINHGIRENNQPFPYNNTQSLIISDIDNYQQTVDEKATDSNLHAYDEVNHGEHTNSTGK